MDNSLSFQNAFHQHGYTATGPGHFAIGSGMYPGPAGVLGNSYYDRELGKVVNCVEDPDALPVGGKGEGRSFSRYNNKAVGDFLKDVYPKSKVISVAGKDRSAIMLAGNNPDLVLYYNNIDRFITSDFYSDSLPSFIDNFNNKLNLQSYRDSLWTKVFPDSLYLKHSREDDFSGEIDWYRVQHDELNNKKIYSDEYEPTFPISFDKNHDPGQELMGTPWFDKVLIDLSKMIISEEEIGLDENPDIFFIGLSAMDYIIHNYGPFSQEAMDYFMRLDIQLDELFKHIDNEIGLEKQLRLVARLIKGGLGSKIYMVSIGGFDTHGNQSLTHEVLLTYVADAIKKFYDDLNYEGIDSKVLSMTFSEFGRRMKDNGSGTDHGSGGGAFIIGNRVNGGLYSEYPSIDPTEWLNGEDMKHTFDYRGVYGTLLEQHLGLDPSEIVLGNFEQLSPFK